MYHVSFIGPEEEFQFHFALVFQGRIRDEETRKQSEFSLGARSGEGRREEMQNTGSCMFIMDLIVYLYELKGAGGCRTTTLYFQ